MINLFKKSNDKLLGDEFVEVNKDIYYFKILETNYFINKFSEIYRSVIEGVTISFYGDKILLIIHVSRNFRLEKDLKHIGNSASLLKLLNVQDVKDYLKYDYDKYGLCDINGNSFKIVKVRSFNQKFSYENFRQLKKMNNLNVTIKLYSHKLINFDETKQKYCDKYKVSKCAIYIKLNVIESFDDIDKFIQMINDLGFDVYKMEQQSGKLFKESSLFSYINEEQANLKVSEKAIKKLIGVR